MPIPGLLRNLGQRHHVQHVGVGGCFLAPASGHPGAPAHASTLHKLARLGKGTVINGIALGSDEFVKVETMRRTQKIVDNIEKIRAVFARSTGEDGRQNM